MFRGKESSNRIKISRLVQDLLNFSVLGSLQLLGVGAGWRGVWGGWGFPHTCAVGHTHSHTHIYRYIKHDNFNCKWLHLLDLGKSRGFPMMSYVCAREFTCMCVHTCAWVWEHPHIIPHPHPPTPPHPMGGPLESLKIQ